MRDLSVTLQRIASIQNQLGFRSAQTGFDQALSDALNATSSPSPAQRSAGSYTLGAMMAAMPASVAPLTHTVWSSAGFVDPLAGTMGSGFGYRSDPFTGEQRMHKGVDISAPEGTPIRAAAGGVVSFAGPNGGFGNLVIVDHPDGLQTYYAHQSVIGVEVGQDVLPGMILGEVGSTGRSTGPHLHFEVRQDGEAIDPASFLPEHDHEGDNT